MLALAKISKTTKVLLRITQSLDGLSDEKNRSAAFLTDCPLAIFGSVWSEVPHAYSRKVKFFQDKSSRGLLDSRTTPISRIRPNDRAQCKKVFCCQVVSVFPVFPRMV